MQKDKESQHNHIIRFVLFHNLDYNSTLTLIPDIIFARVKFHVFRNDLALHFIMNLVWAAIEKSDAVAAADVPALILWCHFVQEMAV